MVRLYCLYFVAEKFHHLLKTGRHPEFKILRIYSRRIEKEDYDYPLPRHIKKHKKKHQRGEQELDDSRCPDWAKPYALHHMIRQSDQNESNALRELEEMIEAMSKKGEIANGMLCNKYRKAKREAEEKFFSEEKFDVIFCTCNEMAGVRVRKQLSPHQCIIDECGMAYEPETIVPISLCEHTVLIGDHMQLQPVIDYRPAKNCGLSTSLFERYANMAKNEEEEEEKKGYTFTLKIQYRMVIVTL